MALNTFSSFYFGHTITIDNQNIPFIENGDSINRIAVMNVGAYTLTDFVNEVARAMNSAGNQNYTVSVDRDTRIISISGDTRTFDLLVTDPEYTEISAFELMGYTSDKENLMGYGGDVASGQSFEPQFILQKYIDFNDDQKANEVTVNQSASGIVEVVKYGEINIMSCNITFQTNIPQSIDAPIINDANGENNLRNFMRYVTTKAPIEFMRDKFDSENYDSCFLESTSNNKTGTGFLLKELYAKKLIGYFETGTIKFRRLD